MKLNSVVGGGGGIARCIEGGATGTLSLFTSIGVKIAGFEGKG